MKSSLLRPILPALLGLGLAINAHCAPVDLVGQAYRELASADHDYKGHRVSAMHKLEAAGKELGVKLRGNTRMHEKQGISDDHLKSAQALLQEAAGGLRGKPLRHVEAAEKEISIALSIK